MQHRVTLFLSMLLGTAALHAQPVLLPSIGVGALPSDGDPICTLPFQTPPIQNVGRPEGEQAADFTLYDLDGDAFNLEAALLAGKPVLMISCSYTCPVFRNKLSRINAVATLYADQLTTILVYTPEAHPHLDISPYFGAVNTGQANMNDGVLHEQPETYGERRSVVEEMLMDLDIQVPVYLDGPCNNWWNYYGPQPNNAYLIDVDGTVHTHHDWFDKVPENIDCDLADLLGLTPPMPCGGQTFAGEFTVQWMSNDTVYGMGGTTLTAHMRLFNSSSTDDVLVRVVKLQNQLPVDWSTSLCLDVCYLPDVDTALVPIAAGDSMDFYYYFYTTPGSSIGYTRIGLRNEDNVNNSYSRQVWGVAEGGVGTNEVTGPASALFAPNPAHDLVNWIGWESNDKLVITDASGRIVVVVGAGGILRVDNLAPGYYTGRHMRNGHMVNTARLVVQR
jgi:hypothetical protein